MTGHCARRLVTDKGAVTGVTAWTPAAPWPLDIGAGVLTTEAAPGLATAHSLPVPVRTYELVPPAAAGRVLTGLADLEDGELLGIVRSLPRASDRRGAACELLVSRYRHLVWSCVRRYRHSPEPAEDLIQVGYVGLLKAINNFDPAFGGSLAAYAQPCITGEIKRHFRDKRFLVHVKRSVQELIIQTREATTQLTQDLGRVPTESDLARYLGVSGADLREAQRAELALRPSSLDAPVAGRPGTASLADFLGEEDPAMDHVLGIRSVAAHWCELPRREQQILTLRFYGDMTQIQIGHQLGISQMHVSRLLAHALGYLRLRLLGLPEHSAAAQLRQLPRQAVAGSLDFPVRSHQSVRLAASPASLS
jgi:RNA polymerase sigma-B factor